MRDICVCLCDLVPFLKKGCHFHLVPVSQKEGGKKSIQKQTEGCVDCGSMCVKGGGGGGGGGRRRVTRMHSDLALV